MVNIADFSSVFEIAFAINALLYIFQTIPFVEKRLIKRLEDYEKTKEEYLKLPNTLDDIPFIVCHS